MTLQLRARFSMHTRVASNAVVLQMMRGRFRRVIPSILTHTVGTDLYTWPFATQYT